MPDQTQPYPPEHLFHEYLDDALDGDARREFETYLAQNPAAIEQLERLRALFSSLENLPAVDLGADLQPAVLAALRKRHNIPSPLRWVAALQVVLLAIVIASSWPLLQSLAQSLQFAAIVSAFATALRANLAAFSEHWGNLIASLASLNIHLSNFVANMPVLNIAMDQLVPLIAAVALLWLVGNGLLLRRLAANQPAR